VEASGNESSDSGSLLSESNSSDYMSDEEEKALQEKRERAASQSGLRKMQTLNRRATIFGDALEEEAKKPTKTRADLKRQQQLHAIEFKTVGKTRQFELVGESKPNLLIRFLLHFFFVEHDHRLLDLFDKSHSVFAHLSKPSSFGERVQASRVGSPSPVKLRRGLDGSLSKGGIPGLGRGLV
jgi:hypothetical protein